MRVLVPLDGTEFAASIFPDARRLAGPDGTLILVRDATVPRPDLPNTLKEQRAAVEMAREYLDTVAQRLRGEGMAVECLPLAVGDPALAIDEAAGIFSVDMVAAATHGWSLAEQWWRGSIAWRALLRCTVPVMLRHADGRAHLEGPRRIMVPLDGSNLAKKALPLAQQLADRWDAEIWLARITPVIPDLLSPTPALPEVDIVPPILDYLEGVARGLHRRVNVCAAEGSAVDGLVQIVRAHDITDVVMTSHGRTGLTRVIVGSVAEGLIHRLHCPVIVIPPLVTLSGEDPELLGAAEAVTP